MSNKKSSSRTITTTNLQLEKPLITDYYDVDVSNRNMDKIDKVYSEMNASILELSSEVNGQRLRGINIANTIIDKLEG